MTAPLALTMGDPAGVGGEIAVAAWRALRASGPAFVCVDDPDRLSALGAPVAAVDDPAEAATVFAERLPVFPEPLAAPAPPGRPDPANAPAVVRAIERAVALAQAGLAAAVVTNPINKKALKDGAGFAFPGHTEFLAALGGARRAVMMIASPLLRVVPATIHAGLVEAARGLSAEVIEDTALILDAALRRDFAIAAPRIAVAGLNPHAGEGGTMGLEEQAIIAPALARLRAQGLDVRGPLPADTMFHPRARATYDAALCMYHDQALIPAKTLAFDEGVNVTLGLPFIRTSPDHGTAYDIAGQGVARPDSLIAALRLARAMADARAA
ncbi:MAG: 4-hydroxythreonine-4-phosphate dehydrogenase PdxA [Rhodobacteraceae bacterium]|nr:MAG: 4-hydroxythreonine-4-phosphate dehydrogenase PdxA [Paracoccaceae bacterium]